MVMVANKKTSQQMADDLSLFLGNNTIKFTTWYDQNKQTKIHLCLIRLCYSQHNPPSLLAVTWVCLFYFRLQGVLEKLRTVAVGK